MYQAIKWTLPNEGSRGLIQDDTIGGGLGFVLGTKKNQDIFEVILEAKRSQRGGIKNSQKWMRGQADEDGWFTLKNPYSGKFLSASDENRLLIEGNG